MKIKHLWVKVKLIERGKTQRDLAQAWSVSDGAVSRWMAGLERHDLPLSRAVKLAKILGVSLDELAKRLDEAEVGS